LDDLEDLLARLDSLLTSWPLRVNKVLSLARENFTSYILSFSKRKPLKHRRLNSIDMALLGASVSAVPGVGRSALQPPAKPKTL
jgi:hypothetical protein